MLLADDAVLRILGLQRGADEGFHVAIGLGNEVLVALRFDGELFEIAKISEAELAGAPRQIDGELFARRIVA